MSPAATRLDVAPAVLALAIASVFATAAASAQDAANPASPSARVERFLATPAAERDHGRAFRRLVADVAGTALPPVERRQLLGRLRQAAEPLDPEAAAYAAVAEAGPAYEAGDTPGALELCQRAAMAKDKGVSAEGLRFLFDVALAAGDLEHAWPWLQRYAGVTDAMTAGLRECELLLRVGMVRAAAATLDRLEASSPTREQALELQCQRLEELLVTEQFAAALTAADTLAVTPGLDDKRMARARLSRAFALARLSRLDEAEALLAALVGDASAVEHYGPRLRAEYALVALARGELAAARTRLGRAATAPLSALGEWPLAARARLDLARFRAGEVGREVVAELRARLAAHHEFALRQWRVTPEVSAGVAFLQWSVRRELLVALCEAELGVGGEDAPRRCSEHLLAADACGSLARRRDWAPATPLQLAAMVPTEGALLWFLPAPHGSLVLVGTASGFRVLPLPSDMRLRGWIRALRENIVDAERAGPDWSAALAALTAPLAAWAYTEPFRAVLAAHRRLTILGREVLTGLPFEFLPSPDAPATWLGHSHAIDYVPSAALAANVDGSTRRVPGAQVALLAVTELTPEVASRYPGCLVPRTPEQLARVVASLAPGTATLEVGVGMHELLEACANVDCLLVLAHGRRRHPADAVASASDRYRPLGIVVRDGFFGAERLDALREAPPIVVLASCGTARAGVDRGEDGQIFGTAWLAAGAGHVLSAEGDLQLAATEQLLAAFLAALAAGQEPAEALRHARTVVANLPGMSHPALHCALRLDRGRAIAPRLLPDPSSRPARAALPGAAASGSSSAWLLGGLGGLVLVFALRRALAR